LRKVEQSGQRLATRGGGTLRADQGHLGLALSVIGCMLERRNPAAFVWGFLAGAAAEPDKPNSTGNPPQRVTTRILLIYPHE